MRSAIVLQHTPTEGPERAGALAVEQGFTLDVRHVYRGDPVPADLAAGEVLIVMGGPMGVADVTNASYPFLQKEVDLLKRLVRHDRPVLGICLGAQLLAHAAGAKVYPNVKMAAPHVNPEPNTDDKMRSPRFTLPCCRQWSIVSGTVVASPEGIDLQRHQTRDTDSV